jgi:hypothetical protein
LQTVLVLRWVSAAKLGEFQQQGRVNIIMIVLRERASSSKAKPVARSSGC